MLQSAHLLYNDRRQRRKVERIQVKEKQNVTAFLLDNKIRFVFSWKQGARVSQRYVQAFPQHFLQPPKKLLWALNVICSKSTVFIISSHLAIKINYLNIRIFFPPPLRDNGCQKQHGGDIFQLIIQIYLIIIYKGNRNSQTLIEAEMYREIVNVAKINR